MRASPGLTAGRGLKRKVALHCCPNRNASPGLTAGRGLKQLKAFGNDLMVERIARPHGRARIETPGVTASPRAMRASPGLTAGRGLKPVADYATHIAGGHRPASRPGAD